MELARGFLPRLWTSVFINEWINDYIRVTCRTQWLSDKCAKLWVRVWVKFFVLIMSLHLEMYTVTSPVSGRFDGMLRSNLAMKGKGEGTVILLVASF